MTNLKTIAGFVIVAGLVSGCGSTTYVNLADTNNPCNIPLVDVPAKPGPAREQALAIYNEQVAFRNQCAYWSAWSAQ